VTIKIYNSSNVLVRTLASGAAAGSGVNTIDWDGKNDASAVVSDGVYTYTIDATDAAGNAAIQKTTTVTVDNAAPVVDLFQVNDGNIQRSMVDSITVHFSKPITYDDATAFSFVRQGGGVTFATNIATSDNQTFVFTFTGASIINHSLADGIYTLTIDHNKIHSASGVNLAADYVKNFHRLFGDADGDGDTDSLDQIAVRNSLSQPYKWYFDFDGNSAVDSSDYSAARARAGIKFVYTP